MKLHYKGKFDGKEETLPQTEHRPGAVMFKEPETKRFTLIANIGALVLAIPLLVLFFWRGSMTFSPGTVWMIWLGCVLSLVCAVPHEFLHAICFKDDVYFYTWLKRGVLFVIGTEDMTKGRYVFMSLLPNLVFGVVPFFLFLVLPNLTWAGMLGVLAIASGFGDYINIYNALTQMPKGALTYMYGFHSYWYLPEK